eukprot:CAMPEP_0182548898 /NCGR_PEP_ID=MMETSP1323-20130603/39467_1 /TAXON_ID=236787 /ORGANISM="Florenciella parvula, Strain RCC1693" /LENGTH=67 /DNA_ID=CAMNT_0024760319 /DNA_START=163 /DNA_END=363 /DNA_ORIENTATION=+
MSQPKAKKSSATGASGKSSDSMGDGSGQYTWGAPPKRATTKRRDYEALVISDAGMVRVGDDVLLKAS